MLKREIDSINRMIGTQYERLRAEIAVANKTANKTLADRWLLHPSVVSRIENLAREFDLSPDVVRSNILGRGYGQIAGSKMPLRLELEATGWTNDPSVVPGYTSTTLHGTVEVALATNTKKWTAIQPAIYAFATDCASAKTIEDLEKSVKVLLSALA